MKDLFFTPQQPTEGRKLFQTLEVVAPLKLASEVPDDCGVYVFYVPGMTTYDDLIKELQNYGKEAGKNIFVGIWSLGATSYSKMLTEFKINKSPAVIITGKPQWSTDGQTPPKTVFATISNPNILDDVKKAGDIINQTCNLFIEGKVNEALSSARKAGYKASLDFYLGKLYSGVLQFLKQVTITWNYVNGTITLGSASGSGTSSSKGSKKSS